MEIYTWYRVTVALIIMSFGTRVTSQDGEKVCPTFTLNGTRFHQPHEGTFVVTLSSRCGGRVTYTNDEKKSRLQFQNGAWSMVEISQETTCSSDAMLYADNDVMHPRDVHRGWREYAEGRFRESALQIICHLSNEVRLSGTRANSHLEGDYHITSGKCNYNPRPIYSNTEGYYLYFWSGNPAMWIVGNKPCTGQGSLYNLDVHSDPIEVAARSWQEYVEGEWKPSVEVVVERLSHSGIETQLVSKLNAASTNPWAAVFGVVFVLCLGLTAALVFFVYRWKQYRRKYHALKSGVPRCGASENDYSMESPVDDETIPMA